MSRIDHIGYHFSTPDPPGSHRYRPVRVHDGYVRHLLHRYLGVKVAAIHVDPTQVTERKEVSHFQSLRGRNSRRKCVAEIWSPTSDWKLCLRFVHGQRCSMTLTISL